MHCNCSPQRTCLRLVVVPLQRLALRFFKAPLCASHRRDLFGRLLHQFSPLRHLLTLLLMGVSGPPAVYQVLALQHQVVGQEPSVRSLEIQDVRTS